MAHFKTCRRCGRCYRTTSAQSLFCDACKIPNPKSNYVKLNEVVREKGDV